MSDRQNEVWHERINVRNRKPYDLFS